MGVGEEAGGLGPEAVLMAGGCDSVVSGILVVVMGRGWVDAVGVGYEVRCSLLQGRVEMLSYKLEAGKDAPCVVACEGKLGWCCRMQCLIRHLPACRAAEPHCRPLIAALLSPYHHHAEKATSNTFRPLGRPRVL
jgi:hypothetical protein